MEEIKNNGCDWTLKGPYSLNLADGRHSSLSLSSIKTQYCPAHDYSEERFQLKIQSAISTYLWIKAENAGPWTCSFQQKHRQLSLMPQLHFTVCKSGGFFFFFFSILLSAQMSPSATCLLSLASSRSRKTKSYLHSGWLGVSLCNI